MLKVHYKTNSTMEKFRACSVSKNSLHELSTEVLTWSICTLVPADVLVEHLDDAGHVWPRLVVCGVVP